MASRGGLGGAERSRGCRPTPACRQKCSGGGAVGCQGGLACSGEAGSAWQLAAGGHESERVRGETRRLGCTRAPNARSARALGVHGTCLKKCQCMLQSLGEAGT